LSPWKWPRPWKPAAAALWPSTGAPARKCTKEKANWDIIRQVKEAVRIPVIGNGDIFTPQDAKRMLETTGCDGVMIGRAALGNPWMLYRTVKYLTTGELPPEPTPREKIEVALEHLDRLIAVKGETIGVKEMRKHAAWYLKGLPHSAEMRAAVNQQTTREGMRNLLLAYAEELERQSASRIA